MEEERNDNVIATTEDGYDVVDNSEDDERGSILAIAAFGTACAGLGYIVIQHVIKPIAKLAMAGIKKLFKKDIDEDDDYDEEDDADDEVEEDDGSEEEQEEKPEPKTKKTRSKRRRK